MAMRPNPDLSAPGMVAHMISATTMPAMFRIYLHPPAVFFSSLRKTATALKVEGTHAVFCVGIYICLACP